MKKKILGCTDSEELISIYFIINNFFKLAFVTIKFALNYN